MAVRKGSKLSNYKQLEKRPRPDINPSDFELFKSLQESRAYGWALTPIQLQIEVEAYLAWNENRGSDFHDLVQQFRELLSR